jgi:hypothetical protein
MFPLTYQGSFVARRHFYGMPKPQMTGTRVGAFRSTRRRYAANCPRFFAVRLLISPLRRIQGGQRCLDVIRRDPTPENSKEERCRPSQIP